LIARLIVDLSFYGINDGMQFGRNLQRLLFKIRHANPKFGPVYMSKVDIADGFYRVILKPNTAPKLAVVLPQMDGEPLLVAIPVNHVANVRTLAVC
jgi:hypothetical protein